MKELCVCVTMLCVKGLRVVCEKNVCKRVVCVCVRDKVVCCERVVHVCVGATPVPKGFYHMSNF